MSGPALDFPIISYYILNPRPTRSGTFIRESHSRLYSPEVFAISQLLSEIPNSIVCAIVYWVLMVYPIGFGAGSAGLDGTGFQLLAILFTEFFGVTLGQLIGAISPSIQVCSPSPALPDPGLLTKNSSGCCSFCRLECCSIPRLRFRSSFLVVLSFRTPTFRVGYEYGCTN